MDLNQLSAAKIKEIRMGLGLTSESVANQLGIAKANYSRLENGKVEISLNRLEALSRIFKIPLHAFLPSCNSPIIPVTNDENSPDMQNVNNNTDPTLVEMLQTSLKILNNALDIAKK